MGMVDAVLDKLSKPADDLVVLDHAAEILAGRGHITAARAVAAIAKYERARGKEGADPITPEHGARAPGAKRKRPAL